MCLKNDNKDFIYVCNLWITKFQAYFPRHSFQSMDYIEIPKSQTCVQSPNPSMKNKLENKHKIQQGVTGACFGNPITSTLLFITTWIYEPQFTMLEENMLWIYKSTTCFQIKCKESEIQANFMLLQPLGYNTKTITTKNQIYSCVLFYE